MPCHVHAPCLFTSPRIPIKNWLLGNGGRRRGINSRSLSSAPTSKPSASTTEIRLASTSKATVLPQSLREIDAGDVLETSLVINGPLAHVAHASGRAREAFVPCVRGQDRWVNRKSEGEMNGFENLREPPPSATASRNANPAGLRSFGQVAKATCCVSHSKAPSI